MVVVSVFIVVVSMVVVVVLASVSTVLLISVVTVVPGTGTRVMFSPLMAPVATMSPFTVRLAGLVAVPIVVSPVTDRPPPTVTPPVVESEFTPVITGLPVKAILPASRVTSVEVPTDDALIVVVIGSPVPVTVTVPASSAHALPVIPTVSPATIPNVTAARLRERVPQPFVCRFANSLATT